MVGCVGPINLLDTLNSIHSNQNIAWGNGIYWLITKTHTYTGFSQINKIDNNANIGIREFTTWKKIQWQNVTPSGNRTRATRSLWFQVQHYPFYTNLTFACKTYPLGVFYSHALLIPL